MRKEKTPEIPVIDAQPQSENCAHSWVKTEVLGRKALKCKHCGKIIDSND